jgi:hypothetical protein
MYSLSKKKGRVMPHLLQKYTNENFKFSRDITISSELKFGSRIYFFLKTWDYNATELIIFFFFFCFFSFHTLSL